MGLKFYIHPILFLLMTIIEYFGVYLAIQVFTGLKTSIKRYVIGAIVFGLISFLVDYYVFDFHKNGLRVFLVLFLLYTSLKIIFNVSMIKSLFLVLLVTIYSVLVDIVILVSAKVILGPIHYLYENYSLAFTLHLILFYIFLFIGKKLNLSLIKLDEFKIF